MSEADQARIVSGGKPECGVIESCDREEHRRMLFTMLQLCSIVQGKISRMGRKMKEELRERCWVNSSLCRHEAVHCIHSSNHPHSRGL